MGIYYKFGCLTDKEYITFNCLKASEMRLNEFDMKILMHFMQMKCLFEPKAFKFLSDENDDMNNVYKECWKNTTCDVLIDMIEDGFTFKPYQIAWTYSQFADAKRLPEFVELIKKQIEGLE